LTGGGGKIFSRWVRGRGKEGKKGGLIGFAISFGGSRVTSTKKRKGGEEEKTTTRRRQRKEKGGEEERSSNR